MKTKYILFSVTALVVSIPFAISSENENTTPISDNSTLAAAFHETNSSDSPINGSSTPEYMPEQFFGEFNYFREENLDKYLKARGYKWEARKIAASSFYKKNFIKYPEGHKFGLLSMFQTRLRLFEFIELNVPFKALGFDNVNYEVTFYVKDGHLFESRRLAEDKESKEQITEYYFDGKILVQKMSSNGVSARRYFIRVRRN